MTDFNKPFEIRGFQVEIEYANRCKLCHGTTDKMIKISVDTAQDGMLASHVPTYICMNCIDKINNVINEREF